MKPSLSLLKSGLSPKIAVDSLAIPLRPPYSLSSLLPPPTPLSRVTISKLHKLSALLPPSTETHWNQLKDLDALAGIMDGVKGVDTSRLEQLGIRPGDIVDGRPRPEPEPYSEEEEGVIRAEEERERAERGEGLVRLAERREGRYFVVPTPEGIRGKRRANKGLSQLEK